MKREEMIKTKTVVIFTLVIAFLVFFFKRSKSTEKFEEDKKKVVFVFADWCGHCTRFKPTWEKIEQVSKKTGLFDVQALNVDDKQNSAFIEQYEVSSFPTIMLFSKGKFTKYDDERDFEKIIAAIDRF